MKITNTRERKVTAWVDDGSVVIQEQERIAWVASTGNRRWSDDRVSVTTEEFGKIVAAHVPTEVLRAILAKREAC